jgi:two-component system response regulator FlrC
MSATQSSAFQTTHTGLRQVLRSLEEVASSRATVLIEGESGTGKELLARYLHAKSHRSSRPFYAVNCAALPDGLLESELFGFEKGAFTGALNRKIGKFEAANNSTFLLDEISELPLGLQAKMLRVLQEGEIERLGGSTPIKVNPRLVATTNRSLQVMVGEGRFREDLFYRLNVIPVRVPPLRERRSDIEMLAQAFADQSCQENALPRKSFSPAARMRLLDWSWPGNVRELKNTIERSVLLCSAGTLDEKDILIQWPVDPAAPVGGPQLAPGMTVAEAERLLIMKTLEFTQQNRTRAADMLGISIRTLRNKINEYKGAVDERIIR